MPDISYRAALVADEKAHPLDHLDATAQRDLFHGPPAC